jgi:hypothetical protein
MSQVVEHASLKSLTMIFAGHIEFRKRLNFESM